MTTANVSIHDVLDELTRSATDERDKGDKFERLVQTYLRTDVTFRERFDEVWLWEEWPGRQGKPDTGIDLVAKESVTGELCAIQCKFYDEDHALQKSDLDSFFTASGKEGFTQRMIVSTTDKWSQHAEDALEGQQVPVTRLRVQDLDESSIDWSQFSIAQPEEMQRKQQKTLRKHQWQALADVRDGLATSDRGKLIMACGTGKTFTSLKIVEEQVPVGGTVLFLVPSISLLSQTLKEWSTESTTPLRPFAVCSDTKVGKKSQTEDIGPYDLAFPASTSAEKLHARFTSCPADEAINVVFSTYQSIKAVARAQELGVPEFDLIVCDEAHRTTGVTLAGEDESSFVKVHDQSFLRARKRLYMTATPRIYADSSKSQAQDNDAELCSMDNEALYGRVLHRLGFGEAVSKGLLTDYKVQVLAVSEDYVSKAFQSQFADEDNELGLDDFAKIVGCWNGLAKRGLSEETFEHDPAPMRRAVAFARSIKDSQNIATMFNKIVMQEAEKGYDETMLNCEVEHVDGSFNVLQRNAKLDWLRAGMDEEDNDCRVLSNARCLSEGVDVPALDAVIFLNPRNSVVDVVQTVGRVMRKAPGKQYGYVILPVGIPADQTSEQALRNNEKYKVVWQVLQALRAHDERFNAMINKIELNKGNDDTLQVIGVGGGEDEPEDQATAGEARSLQGVLDFPGVSDWREALYAKIVQKVGNRRYWENWANTVADIAERHITRITSLVAGSDPTIRTKFETFLAGLRQNLNEGISESDAIEMLSQHLITKPVFEALFEGYSFSENNPVSLVMQDMVEVLESQALETETQELDSFYESVRQRAVGIDNAEGKQQVIVELYEKFFSTAFPRTADRLGIVYTPVQIVDFIIRSAEAALHKEFGASLNDDGVHVLDPFTGTGTFMARLLQSGLIQPENLLHKYQNDLHANEIVLLSYYIAAINIEATYHGMAGGEYQPFEGIVLADTFQMSEHDGSLGESMFPENNQRVLRQRNSDIQVILGNPPYSAWQESANDASQNVQYQTLDEAIRLSYAAGSTSQNKNSLYDSYIRAIRWASDRVKDKGIVCFVSNGAFLDGNATAGLRKSLVDEFTSIYCFNLRGNQRTSGETSKREGGKVFGSGSRSTVAITLLIRNPDKTAPGEVHYHDIGDYLTRGQKLQLVREFGSIAEIPWTTIHPNADHDWINQRSDDFTTFTTIGSKDKSQGDESRIFPIYASGLQTNRDAWVYGFSIAAVSSNVQEMIDFYNEQVSAYRKASDGLPRERWMEPDSFVNKDPTKIKWSSSLLNGLRSLHYRDFSCGTLRTSYYRPFCKQHVYFSPYLNHRVSLLPQLFPTPSHPNHVIVTPGAGKVASKGFSALMQDEIPSIGAATAVQCFPLYYYEKLDDDSTDEVGLFEASSGDVVDGYRRLSAISDETVKTYRAAYGNHVTTEDIFYYVYGILHSPEYVSRYSADLQKMLPRIPMVTEFAEFSAAGRKLAELHLGYESVKPYPVDVAIKDQPDMSSGKLYRVQKMRFGPKKDRSTIIYNSYITVSGIPEAAYDYVIQGRNAVDWIMQEYQVSTDKDSGIVNDPNDWSDDPRYILDLLCRLIRVAVETQEIVKDLPALELLEPQLP